MNLTLAAWLTLFVLFALLAFKRPAWGVSLYMLTFFGQPALWWWGKHAIGHYRWSLYGGIGLLAAVILSRVFQDAGSERPASRIERRLSWIAVAILVNATLVHVLLAPSMEMSSGSYWLLAKFVLLFFMIVAATRTREDLRIILLSIVLGAGYIGYEVTVNDRGGVTANRLEGVGAPGATGANQCASLMVTVLPITGAFFMAGRRWEKLAMLPIAPFIVNVILLCNSRGAFLSCFAAAGALVFFAPAKVRKRVLKLLGLGAVAVWLLLGDPRIVERFTTTFAPEEERDSSAAGRLDYWLAGLHMIADHPLGAGGYGFKRVYGPRYIQEVNDKAFDSRAVHNGFINEACEWGIQGFVLRMAFLGGGLLLLWRMARSRQSQSDLFGHLLVCTLFAGTMGFLITCTFGDFLDAEWGYWMIAIAVAHSRVASSPATVQAGRHAVTWAPLRLRGRMSRGTT